MGIELLGSVTPILMIGESHSLAFRDLLFRPTWAQQHFICRTRFLPMLPGSAFSLNGSLNAELARELVQEGLLDRDLRPAFLHSDPSVAFISGAPVLAPPAVFFGGDTELVYLFKQIGNQFDFELPDDPGYGVDRRKLPIAYAVVQQQLADLMTPFVSAVASLAAHRFTRLMIHAIPPRSPDDDKAGIFASGIVVAAPVRAKLALLANRQLAALCALANIGFIDTWPETTDNGYLRPEFELDGIHVNRKAALISLEKITARLFDRTAGSWNPDRYGLLLAQAQRRTLDPGPAANWRAHGMAAMQLDVPAPGELEFAPCEGNPHARTDWTGWPRAGRAGAMLAAPSQAVLERLLAWLGEGAANALLHAGSECEMTVISLRSVHGADPGVDPVHDQVTPPGLRRALLQLSGSSGPLLQTLEGEAVTLPVGGAGTLVVYDPLRLRLRPTADASVVEMVLIPRLAAQPFRVMWAGLCEFPADPFQYSVQGMRAAPALDTQSFSARAWRA